MYDAIVGYLGHEFNGEWVAAMLHVDDPIGCFVDFACGDCSCTDYIHRPESIACGRHLYCFECASECNALCAFLECKYCSACMLMLLGWQPCISI